MICPNCKQDDATQKATAAGIAAPQQPSSAPPAIARVLQLFGGCYYLFPIGIFVFALLGLGLSAMLQTGETSYGYDPILDLVGKVMIGVGFIPLLCMLPILVLFGIGLLWLPSLVKRHVIKAHDADMARWRRKSETFNALCYCSRCAGVFLAGQSQTVPLEAMDAFLSGQPALPPPPRGPAGA